jgi:hypothetical protein
LLHITKDLLFAGERVIGSPEPVGKGLNCLLHFLNAASLLLALLIFELVEKEGYCLYIETTSYSLQESIFFYQGRESEFASQGMGKILEISRGGASSLY